MNFYHWWSDKTFKNSERLCFDLEVERDAFLCLPGGAHPRTKGGGMRRGFVMRVMRGVRDGLWVHHAAQDEKADG